MLVVPGRHYSSTLEPASLSGYEGDYSAVCYPHAVIQAPTHDSLAPANYVPRTMDDDDPIRTYDLDAELFRSEGTVAGVMQVRCHVVLCHGCGSQLEL